MKDKEQKITELIRSAEDIRNNKCDSLQCTIENFIKLAFIRAELILTTQQKQTK